MAKPRVFISSTFYDLRQVRSDLERFIREMGYEPVLHERGSIPYGSEEKPEEYAYREVETCDIVVAIVGGRYGSASQYHPDSISQHELRTAVALGKQIYVFIDQSVYNEYYTYLENKETEGMRFRFVDDVKVFQFVEEVYDLRQGNPIASFETSIDIIGFLREQWSGLFHRFLQDQERRNELAMLGELQNTAKTLDQLVSFLTEERRNQDEAVRSILLLNHPAFARIKDLLDVPYRVVFTNRYEMEAFLNARSYHLTGEEAWDEKDFEEWRRHNRDGANNYLHIKSEMFEDDGKLKIFTSEEWEDDWMWLERTPPPRSSGVDPEDLPF